ncbi:protein PAT1 homolog 1 [Centruroides vittatus]|uniref:protein PAT1 homolog 1 n=1 Tax=Centruroides vittatus TaxID=120091 RepID=UPI00350EA8B3
MSLKSPIMDSFFVYNAELSALGADKQDELLLTAEVDEDEYDALNDETFGDVADGDDWEENHEKLAKLDMKLLDNDENDDYNREDPHSVVEKSISQLGLDDLDDPAIMTCGRPQIKETSFNEVPFSPFISNVHRLEDLERDFLNKNETHKITSINNIQSIFNQQNKTQGNIVDSIAHNWAFTNNDSLEDRKENWSYSSSLPINYVRTVDEVEKSIFSKPRAQTIDLESHLCRNNQGSPPSKRSIQPPIGTPPQGSNIIPPKGLHKPSNLQYVAATPSVLPPPGLGSQLQRFASPTLLCQPPMVKPFLPFPQSGFLGRLGKNPPPIRIPFGPCNFPIVNENSVDTNMNQKILLENFKHPHYYSALNWAIRQQNEQSGKHYQNDTDDSYDGLMSTQEKHWLIKIQMRQLQSDNPYLDDYYYTTFISRKKVKEKENGLKSVSKPKVLLPERTKHESRTYVPTQFEGSLGKLQVASVNNPRKILDLDVCRLGDDDDKTGSSHRFRYLLLSIEKLYSVFLEIEDEDKHILALPEQAQIPHQKTRQELIDKLFCGFVKNNGNSTDDNFIYLLSVRKGRNLAMRSLPFFDTSKQVTLLELLCRGLSMILRKDQNDLVLLQHCNTVLEIIDKLDLEDIVTLTEAIQNVNGTQIKEKSNYSIAFQTKFGTDVIANLLKKGEHHFKKIECNNELYNRWESVMAHIVDILYVLPESVIDMQSNIEEIMSLLGRYCVNKMKLEIILKRLDKLKYKEDCNYSDNVNRRGEEISV